MKSRVQDVCVCVLRFFRIREYLPEKSRKRDYATELRISRQEKNALASEIMRRLFFLRRKLFNLIPNMIPNYLNFLEIIFNIYLYHYTKHNF